jgi:serine/threonine protein kinase/tetratricopeptide (TPR) repeat protein
LFHQVAELPPERRTTYLAELRDEDPLVLEDVRSLLDYLEDETISALAPTVEAVDGADEDLVGRRVGPYHILQLIGEGGFGSVYMAEQEEPVRRKVALKIIKLGMDTKQVIARFEAERQALAMMEHPNIARVYDAGATDTGRPYFVMELVRGIPITQYADKDNLSTRERLKLFTQVCHAVQHAHQKGVIHRDIKPSNVLVTMHDGTPVPKVIDFGIAKATSKRLTEKTLFTEFRQFVGTPEYMSPEQAEMSGLDVDTRTDIYSLGVLLYELLTGTTPFDAQTLRRAAYGEIQRIIREEEPVTPSHRLSTLGDALTDVAQARQAEPHVLSRLIRGDLDWIVMRALEKDRTRRYETAADLAADIQRHLHNEPVQAGPPGARYKLRKFIRRNQAAVVGGTVVTAALLVGFTLATIGLIQANRERDRALQAEQRSRHEAERSEREAESASAINAFFNELLATADPMQLRTLSAFSPEEGGSWRCSGGLSREVFVAEILRGAGAEIADAFAGKPELEATARETIGTTLRGLGLYTDAEPHLLTALELRRRTLGDEDPLTLRSALAVAELLLDVGRSAEAEEILRTTYRAMYFVYGETDPRTLYCSAALATALSDQLKHSEAESMFCATLEKQRKILGPEHRDTLTTLWKWSFSYLLQWNTKRGPDLAHELWNITRRTLSPDDPLNILCKPLVGWWHVERFEYGKAEDVLRPGLAQCRRILGDRHPNTYMTMYVLARSLVGREVQAEKEELLREALAGLQDTRGRSHWQTMRMSMSLADWLAARGQHGEAEDLCRATIADCVAAHGEDHASCLDVMSRLMGLLSRRGKLDEAIDLRRKRVALTRKRWGPGSAVAIEEMLMLASELTSAGRVAEARDVTREVLELRRNAAMKSPRDVTAVNNYAWNLLTCVPTDLRDLETAAPLARRAVKLSKGESSPALDTLALVHHLKGDYDEAVKLQKQSLELLPPEQGYRLEFGATLVRYLLHQGDHEGADTYIQKSIDKWREALGDDNPVLGHELTSAGKMLMSAGHYEAAEALFREGLALNRKLLGADHEQVTLSLALLAGARAAQGDYHESAQAYREAYELRRRLLGDDDLRVVNAMKDLGKALHAGGDSLAAAPVLREALEGYRRLDAAGTPAALALQTDLACALTDLGALQEAEPLIREALTKTEAIYGQEHFGTVAAQQVLGWLLVKRGEPGQAEPLLQSCVDTFSRLDIPEHLAWLPAQGNSALGECLAAQQRFDEAEPLLVQGYDTIQEAKGDGYILTRIALERVIGLYEAWGKTDQVARWRAKVPAGSPIAATR